MKQPSRGSIIDDLHPELRKRYGEIERAKEMLERIVSGMSQVVFNRRPDEISWSVAECIDHLNTTARAVLPKFDTAIAEGIKRDLKSDGPYKYGWLTEYLVEAASAYPPKRRVKSPEVFRPKGEMKNMGTVVSEFRNLQPKLIELLYRSNGLDLGKVKVVSPVTRLLRFGLGQYLRLVTRHQIRHLHQAENVKSAIGQKQPK